MLDLYGYLIIFIITLLTGAVSAYFVGFGKKSSEIQAMKEKIDDLCDQTARLTDAQKAIEHHYWKKQEVEVYRRDKLEELLETTSSAMELLASRASAAKQGTFNTSNRNLLIRVRTIAMLYFPELDAEIESFCKHYTAVDSLLPSVAENPVQKDMNQLDQSFRGIAEQQHMLLIAAKELTSKYLQRT